MTAPVLRDFPDRFETRRLRLRCPMPGDGPALNAAVAESRESLGRWMAWAGNHGTVADSEEGARRAHAAFLERTDLRLHLFKRDTGELVGSSGMHRVDWDVPKFEIGYWCRSSFEGGGYITEAVRGIASFAFEHLGARRLEICCHHLNRRSARVAERSGFRLEAELRDAEALPDGSLGNTLIYSMLPDDPDRPADSFRL